MANLTDMQATVLRTVNNWCTHDSGWYTGELAAHIGRQPGRDSNRQHSSLISETLHELEVLGLVKRLDDKTPIVWCKATA